MSAKPSEVVATFYAAVAQADAAALTSLIGEAFNENASVIWPEGLPYGGEITGAVRLAKVFGGMATSPVPVGPQGLEVVSIVDGGDQVGAQLSFSWRAPGSEEEIPSGAFELWTFDGGLVTEIKAYYWDTAACAELTRRVAAAAATA